MRSAAACVLVLLHGCGGAAVEAEFGARLAVVQEMVSKVGVSEFDALCVTVDSAFSSDGVLRPPEGFAESVGAPAFEIRRYGDCAENPGLPGFRWNATLAGRREVLVGIAAVDSLTAIRAVIHGLWMADGLTGEDYRCEVVLVRNRAWMVERCDLTGVM